MIKGVIFDLDGVLVNTDELHYLAWRKIADRENIYFDREINHRQRGVSRMESLEILLEKSNKPYNVAQKHEMTEIKNNEYRRLLAQLTPDNVLPGTVEILGGLCSLDIKLAVGSSSRNTPLILDRTGLQKWFDAVADGNDISASKPDPQVFLLAAERMNLPAEVCLVVEDAMVGVEAAKRANMRVLGIGNDKTLPGVIPCMASLADISATQMLSMADIDANVNLNH